MLAIMLMLALNELAPDKVWKLEEHGIFQFWTSFDVSPDDRLAVIDPREKQLLLIGADGKLQARCGREGKGPGEFQRPVVVQWMPEEKAFLVFDSTNRRASLWSSSGKLSGEFAVPVNLLPGTEFADRDNLFYVWKQHGEGGNKPTLLKYHVPSRKYAPLRAFELKDKKFTKAPLPRGEVTMILPWDGVVSFDIGKDFIAVTFPDIDGIILLDFNGKKLGAFTPRLQRYPITAEQVETVLEERPKIMADALRAHRDKVIVPESWPVITGIRIDDRNRIWVTGAENKADGYHQLAIYDREGERIWEGRIQNTPRRLHGNALYYIHIGEDSNVNLQKVTVTLP
ncbi:MAG: hypothetical protein QNK37_35285 [Acidobacteriota bacterium]|nr:hypothetical protein [Acidobacteriota bacterium]